MTETTASSHLSIGEVLSLVQEDFPDVTISKIRFLESQGLIAPERTGSGYRKFYDADIDRLRWILRQQRDHFLPLKVIKKMLDEGVDLHGGTESQPTLWSSAESLPGGSSTDEAEDAGNADDHDDDGDDADDASAAGDEDRRSAGYRSPSHPAVASATARRRPGDQSASEPAAAATAEPANAAASSETADLPAGSPTPTPESPPEDTSSGSDPEPTARPAGRDEPGNAPSSAGSATPERGDRSQSGDTTSSAAARHTQPSPAAHTEPAAAGPAESAAPESPEPARPAHSTPADVVAALQEDPRSARRGRGRPARGGESDTTSEPPMPAAASASTGGFVPTPPLSSLLSADELCELCGISPELLTGLEQFGLIVPASLGGRSAYDADAVDVARIAATYVELGVEPRHLRMYKVAAEREAGFIEQLVVPLIKQRNPAARQQANERCEDLVTMGAQLHAALLRRQLSRLLGP